MLETLSPVVPFPGAGSDPLSRVCCLHAKYSRSAVVLSLRRSCTLFQLTNPGRHGFFHVRPLGGVGSLGSSVLAGVGVWVAFQLDRSLPTPCGAF